MSFKIENGIPLHEAASFFLKLKTAAPDETGALEGQFAAPVEEVLAHMAEMVQNELATHYAYIVYSESLRDLAHHSIAQELHQHAYHETEHAEFLLRRMSVLGGAVEVPDIPAPPPSSDATEIVKTMIQMEQTGIANWQQLRKLVGEDNPTRFKIEEYLTREQEHLDELWQLLPHTETAATAGTPPAAVDPQGAPPMTVATPDEAVDTEAAAAKTAGVRAELIHPETLRFHGAAMKLALSMKAPTVFVPEMDMEGNLKEAAAKMSNAMMAEAGPAMGKVPPPAPPPPALSGAAAGQHAKLAERFKLALSEMGGPPSAQPVPGGEEASELDAYLAEEGAAMEQQNVAEDQHYRERFTEAMQRLQAAEQAQQAAEEQVAQLTEQASMSSETNQQALQQAQMIQDQAMQQVNAANTAAAAAMQKSLAASNETLQQQQLATQMRDAMQTLKTQLMGIVNTQLPPSTTMEAGVSAAADQAAADQQAQEQALMGGQDPSGNQAGTPAASGDAGTPPGSSTPGKDGPGASPTASDPSSSPAAEKKTESSESSPDDDKPAPEASKEGAAHDRFVGALMGGAAGAGITALENRGRASSNDNLRGKVQKLEAAEQSGQGGFGNALNIAQSKMRLAAGELAQKHPHAATALGAGLGAMAGANAAPHVRDLATTLRG